MSHAVAFREKDHTYWIGEEQIPNVTSIIDVVMNKYINIDPAVMEHARQEGEAIHRMIELWCSDNLDADNLPAWMRSYYRAWLSFVLDTGFKLIASEEIVYHGVWGYTGKLDLVCELPKLKMSCLALIDIKRSFAGGAFIGMQTAAYLLAWNYLQQKDKCKDRFALRFLPDKVPPYRLEPFQDAEDFPAFLGLLTCYRWLKKHNLLTRKK